MPRGAVASSHSWYRRHLLRAANVAEGLTNSAVAWTAVSELVASQVRESVRSSDVRVLSNGIDLEYWQAARASGDRRRSPLTLVSAMRLHRKKRPRQLVESFAHAVSRAQVPARLIIVGDGPERRSLERLARELGLVTGEPRVEMRGWLSHEELRAVYGNAHAFVLASTREAFGIATLEAAAAGLPIIAMESAGSSEFLSHGRNALLCGDDADLVRALTSFMADATIRAELSASVEPLRRYDWSVVLAQHEDTYQRARRLSDAVAVGAGSAPNSP
jgi:glycosyltransferase involved in cell wall biosynthesis